MNFFRINQSCDIFYFKLHNTLVIRSVFHLALVHFSAEFTLKYCYYEPLFSVMNTCISAIWTISFAG